jgi:DNA-directed RNA polymerase beta subunit
MKDKNIKEIKETLPCDISYKTNNDDSYLILHQFIKENGLVNHALDSGNDFVDIGIPEIVQKVFPIDQLIDNTRNKTPQDLAIKKIRFIIDIHKINLKKPVTASYKSGNDIPLFPIVATLKDRTYSNGMFVDAKITAIAYNHDGTEVRREDNVVNYKMANIPTMTKSNRCNLYKKSRKTLIEMKEDPKDPGAYYIKSGKEWSIDNIESICFNKPRIFNNSYKNEVQRLEFISKPGDTYQNSKEIILRLLTNNALTLEINFKNMKTVQFPFYLIFRAMGWSTDKEIFDNILYTDIGYPGDKIELDTFQEKMFDILKNAYAADYDTKQYKFSSETNEHSQRKVLEFIVRHMPRENYKELDFQIDEHLQQGINDFLKSLDEHFLPHIGMTEHSRKNKLRFLGRLINRMMYVNLGLIEQTDRDSYVDKRVHGPGVSLSKTFKTHYATIVTQIKKQFTKEFKAMSFDKVQLKDRFESAIHGGDLERLLMQSITSGNKTDLKVNRYKSITNRLSSQLVDRKNPLKVLSTLRMIITPGGDSSKESDRAKEMRMPHLSAQGFACLIQSPEGGEKVGLHKQMAQSATLTRGSSSEYLKGELLKDTEHIIPLDNTDPYDWQILAAIYVNGHWIGGTKDSLKLVTHYTKMRRELQIDKFISIEWYTDKDEIWFWTDYARISRPVAIVYNNIRDWERLGLKGPANLDKFEQGDLMTPEIIEGIKTGKYTCDDLIKKQIIEFLTPGEQIRMDIAADSEHLEKYRHDPTRQFTHVDNNKAMFGLAALMCPLANCSQTPRVTFETSQVRQTGSYYANNWAFRIDKDTFLQYQVGIPIAATVANAHITPCGDEVIVAVDIYTGYNEEDSMIFNKATSELGKFNGSWFTFEKDEIDKNEIICNPDITKTLGIKKWANYGKLGKSGIIQEGTIVKQNDIMIGKVRKLQKNIAAEKKMEFTDESMIYKGEFPAIVHHIILDKDDDGTEFIKIGLRSLKPIIVGDKFCRKETAEVLTTEGWVSLKDLTMEHKVATLVDDKYIEYVNPIEIYKFECVDEPMYQIKTDQINEICTFNHKMYIQYEGNNNFELVEAKNVCGKQVKFKKDGIMQDADMTIKMKYNDKFIESSELCDNFLINLGEKISTNKFGYHEPLPDFCLKMNMRQSKLFLKACCHENDNIIQTQIYTSSNIIPDQFGIIAFHAGCISKITQLESFSVTSGSRTYYMIELYENIDKQDKQYKKIERIVKYTGNVMCIEVPSHVFYCRESRLDPPSWTGNSSRSGQKAVCSIQYAASNMLYTANGMRPDMIMNPHSYPKRMTNNQPIESAFSKICCRLGVTCDISIFRQIEVDDILAKLEEFGMNKRGKERMFNGFTGHWIDGLIFSGPVYYQRLQKFVAKSIYSIDIGPTDIITHQPLDGKANKGGLRISELQRDVYIAGGLARTFAEKMFEHSDDFEIYICRCGHAGIVNKHIDLYRCLDCGDNADIYVIHSSWSSKQFFLEASSMHIGCKLHLDPFTFYEDIFDN